jgi:hypothetical protein
VSIFRVEEARLTVAELLKELRTIQGAFNWNFTKELSICAALREDSNRRAFDPITAVAYFRTGQYFPPGHCQEAAQSIGLLYSDAADILAACNYDWDASCRQGALRQEFIAVLMPNLRPNEADDISVNDIFARLFRKGSAAPTH